MIEKLKKRLLELDRETAELRSKPTGVDEDRLKEVLGRELDDGELDAYRKAARQSKEDALMKLLDDRELVTEKLASYQRLARLAGASDV